MADARRAIQMQWFLQVALMPGTLTATMQNGTKSDAEKFWPLNIGSASLPKPLDFPASNPDIAPRIWLLALTVVVPAKALRQELQESHCAHGKAALVCAPLPARTPAADRTPCCRQC